MVKERDGWLPNHVKEIVSQDLNFCVGHKIKSELSKYALFVFANFCYRAVVKNQEKSFC
jgi:hypothetical protein